MCQARGYSFSLSLFFWSRSHLARSKIKAPPAPVAPCTVEKELRSPPAFP